jgi:protein O-GlcNAc transferase
VPNSRLFLKSSGLENPGIAEPLKARCAAAGLPMDRVTLQGYLPDARSHLAAYSQIDIALDPFPYHGTTTTCEALWMGRPVVTLAGDRHSSRVGVSLLHAVGHSTWIAGDHESYVKLATELAADPSLLVAVAIQLRDDVAKSPLRQPGVLAESFVNALEAELALLGPAVTAA